MPDAGRRRTPGLRREEVAVLAGVGLSWYTWLEQGREINVSGSVLDAISRACCSASRSDGTSTCWPASTRPSCPLPRMWR